MDALEIIILAAAIALVVFTAVFNIARRKKGKSSCGCDCKGCSRAKLCGGNKKTDSVPVKEKISK